MVGETEHIYKPPYVYLLKMAKQIEKRIEKESDPQAISNMKMKLIEIEAMIDEREHELLKQFRKE